MAGSCRAAAVLSKKPEVVCAAFYDYGRNVGTTFQIVDDLLDFTASEAILGKPVASDLKNGHLTAPVLFALEEFPQLREMIAQEFSEPGSFEEALDLIYASDALSRTRLLAKSYAHRARTCLDILPPSEARQGLLALADYALERVS